MHSSGAPAGGKKTATQALYQTVNALATLIAERDTYTSDHQNGTSTLARLLAQRLGLSGNTCNGIRVAGTLHDIGKIAVPREILDKPGRLTASEMGLVREHCDVGYRILEPIDFPWPVAQAVLQHHERLDGSGYPQGLAADDIIIEARVLSVADTIESMLSDRPYRRGLSVQRVEEELESLSGKTLDADVVATGVQLLRDKRKALSALSGTEISSPAIARIWDAE